MTSGGCEVDVGGEGHVCVFMYVCACVCVLGEREGLKLPPIFWPMQYVVINDVSF